MKKRTSFDPNIPNPEKLAKQRKLREKLNITKDTLTLEDITSIISSITLTSISNKEELEALSKKIFCSLDKGNKGEIKTDSLIDEIILRNSLPPEESKDEDISTFFTKINQELSTKSENIISKLKRIKRQQWASSDKSSIEDIEWIITAISEKNLYDFDTSIITKHLHNKNKKRESQFGFLVKYSQMEDQARKEKDIRYLRKKSRFYIGGAFPLQPLTNNANSNSSRMSNTSLKRRSTTLSSMIAPSIIAKIFQQVQIIDTPEFDIFALNSLLGKKTSIYIANEILFRFDIVDSGCVSADTLKLFIDEIVTHYDREKAIYHNDLHAGDVMQTVFTIFTQGNIENKAKMGELDIFVILVAALCHDFKHPGVNNLYLVNSRSKIATRYNDSSVLENFHIAQTFKVLSKKQTNIFSSFTPEEYRISRRRMVESILSTDMANHQSVITGMKVKLESYDVNKGTNFEKIFEDDKNVSKLFEAQQSVINMILHSSDISNPAKPAEISTEWTKRVYGEFFVQGDLEKKQGLKISNFCDRNTTNINKAMVGFINFVVMPTIEILVSFVPEVEVYREYCKANLKRHKIGAINDDKKKK